MHKALGVCVQWIPLGQSTFLSHSKLILLHSELLPRYPPCGGRVSVAGVSERIQMFLCRWTGDRGRSNPKVTQPTIQCFCLEKTDYLWIYCRAPQPLLSLQVLQKKKLKMGLGSSASTFQGLHKAFLFSPPLKRHFQSCESLFLGFWDM